MTYMSLFLSFFTGFGSQNVRQIIQWACTIGFSPSNGFVLFNENLLQTGTKNFILIWKLNFSFHKAGYLKKQIEIIVINFLWLLSYGKKRRCVEIQAISIKMLSNYDILILKYWKLFSYLINLFMLSGILVHGT